MRPRSHLDSAVARFMLGTVLAVGVIAAGGYIALRGVATDEAERATRERVRAAGRLVEAAGLQDGVLRGDRAALRRLDDLVAGQVLDDSIVRVKVWTRDGRILYADEPLLVGRRYILGEDELRLFRTGGAEAETSDLTKPENRFERPQGKLIEAHTTIRTPGGTQVLFEIYERFSAVDAAKDRLLGALAPPLIAGLVVLVLVQLPLALAMARRLQRGHRARELLLANAVDASHAERRRIAADLHDGVVQDVAGVAFGLAPLAADAERRGDAEATHALRRMADTLRQSVRGLRSLLVEIHPPNLGTTGLGAALSDLLSPLEADGVRTTLEIADPPDGARADDTLLYRAAREAIRNAREHARPSTVHVAVTHPDVPPTTRLVVRDDGVGFTAEARERRGTEGHLGLTLLEDLAREAGGTLTVDAAPGRGTTVALEVPRA